jgi:hypothetical protein
MYIHRTWNIYSCIYVYTYDAMPPLYKDSFIYKYRWIFSHKYAYLWIHIYMYIFSYIYIHIYKFRIKYILRDSPPPS